MDIFIPLGFDSSHRGFPGIQQDQTLSTSKIDFCETELLFHFNKSCVIRVSVLCWVTLSMTIHSPHRPIKGFGYSTWLVQASFGNQRQGQRVMKHTWVLSQHKVETGLGYAAGHRSAKVLLDPTISTLPLKPMGPTRIQHLLHQMSGFSPHWGQW